MDLADLERDLVDLVALVDLVVPADHVRDLVVPACHVRDLVVQEVFVVLVVLVVLEEAEIWRSLIIWWLLSLP